ncbi:tigger transposable element-derived protein 4-like [Acipenser oxyrinchus oxyrinchus]|uniref:Tigger transposable element-derived protein 4-like n=1 Tax=Acipenser oxyrinchus oxyrinchus TaxID=40147 RepID=A0AAD8CJH8_ACIOX|nr:tigger transposable element-derived protein 4-like [Acipenser oxyrinchus oxyrinchus]
MSRRRTDLTSKQKTEIIRLCEASPTLSFTAVAKNFSINPSTVSKIYKNRHTVLQQCSSNVNRKRQRSSHAAGVDKALLRWFQFARASNRPVSGNILKNQALKFAADLNADAFKATNGWLDRWKKRHGIVLKRAQGEKIDADVSSGNSWVEKEPPAVLQRYRPGDVYNADQTGLYYRALACGSRAFKKTAHLEDRLALLVCCSMTGEKRPLLLIGKSPKPRCLRGVGNLPIPYTYSSNAWMTSYIFQRWLKQWDTSLKVQRRRIALLVDNCPADRAIKLDSIELIIRPANVSSPIQPGDQGVIPALKAHYRRLIASKNLAATDAVGGVQPAPELARKIDLFTTMLLIKESWDSVQSENILNCFRTAGFSKEGAPTSVIKEEAMVLDGFPEDELSAFTGADNDAECIAPLEDEQIVGGEPPAACAADEEGELPVKPGLYHNPLYITNYACTAIMI